MKKEIILMWITAILLILAVIFIIVFKPNNAKPGYVKVYDNNITVTNVSGHSKSSFVEIVDVTYEGETHRYLIMGDKMAPWSDNKKDEEK